MTELSFENPEGGEPRAASDGKIRTALVRLKETINGELDHTNLTGSAGITDAQLASPNDGTHKLLLATSGFLSEEKAAATWFPSFTGGERYRAHFQSSTSQKKTLKSAARP